MSTKKTKKTGTVKRRKLGDMLTRLRERKGWSRKQIAGLLEVTPAYVGHLENASHVHLSDDLKCEYENAFDVKIPKTLQTAQNEYATKWMRNYRRRRA